MTMYDLTDEAADNKASQSYVMLELFLHACEVGEVTR